MRILMVAILFAAPVAAKDLRLVAIDVEGGAANLYITPGGKSLLIDTGFPTGMGGPRGVATTSSAERIAAAARAAGLTRIDHVLVTHYHADHVGGVIDLVKLIPVGEFIDHGPNREMPAAGSTPGAWSPVNAYPQYEAAIAGKKHRVMKAGERLDIDGLEVIAVASDGDVLGKPMPGAGRAGVDCGGAATEARDGGEENWRSLGVLMRWGKARVLALGDSTLRIENRLACPRNLVGPVDLMFASNHGSDNSTSPQLYRTLKPRVVLVSNGPMKGADRAVLERLKALPQPPVVWQLHSATRSPEADTAPERIANVEATTDNDLQVRIAETGAVTVENPRTRVASTYSR